MFLKLPNCIFKCFFLLSLLFSVIGQIKTQKSENETECLSDGCKDAAKIIKDNIDENKDPCKNFYKFACDKFIDMATIPEDKKRINYITKVQEKVQLDMKSSLERVSNSSDLRIFRLIKKFYEACMNSTGIEENSLRDLLNIINEVGGWPVVLGDDWDENQFEWWKVDVKLKNLGYPPKSIFNIFVFNDIRNTSKNLLYIDPFLPYLNAASLKRGKSDPVVSGYEDFMINVAKYFNATKENIKSDLRSVLKFELSLLEASLNTEVPKTKITKIKHLSKVAPSIPWKEYINNFTEPIIHMSRSDHVYVRKPHYFYNIEKLLKSTPKRVIANYMIWRIIADSIPYMNKGLRDVKTIFDQQTGYDNQPERWQQCLKLLTSESGLVVGASALYVREHFNNISRTVVTILLHAIVEEIKELMSKDIWLDERTKAVALRKSDFMVKVIAYPDELVDNATINNYSQSLKITRFDHFQNYLNLKRFHFNYSISGLLESTDQRLWVQLSDSTIPNAYYYNIYNAFAILAAILQYPIFNPEWPTSALFGSVGFIIGHEIMHAYDMKNILYDETGSFHNWLSKEDSANLKNKVQCFVDQYSNYVDDFFQLPIDGEQTVNENLADNVGMRVVFNAFKRWLSKSDEKVKLPGLKYTPEQIFWISSVSFLCSKNTEDQVFNELMFDPHTPDSFRVIGTVSNSPDFAEVFQCPQGSPMNPKKKCKIY